MKRYLWIKLSILTCSLLAGIILFQQSRVLEAAAKYQDKGVVYDYEIKDLFWIADIGEEEAEDLLLPQVSSILTWKDADYIYRTLGFFDIVQNVSGERITRSEWFACYDMLLKALGKDEEVSVMKLRYLGQVPGEQHIVTDQGNFETSIDKDFWNYGMYYQVYTIEGKILGVREELSEEPEETGQEQLQRNSEEEDSQENDAEAQSGVTEAYQTVKVLLTNDNAQNALRSSFQIRCTAGCTLKAGDETKEYGENTIVTEKNIADFFEDTDTVVTITPKKDRTIYIQEADTKSWSAPYRGSISVHCSEDGYWLINTVSMEEYLYGVVPGEMPEDFELEALKAQAVCARTFACDMICGTKFKAYGADVDDSVNSQVYNKNGENKKAIQAVDETKGMVLSEGDTLIPADIYYYSTSCGFTSGLEAWGQKNASYLACVTTLKSLPEECKIQQEEDSSVITKAVVDWDSYLKRTDLQAYDSHSRYFRWKAYVTLPEGYSVKIEKREESGVVTDISYQKGDSVRHVTTENDIRQDIGKYLTKIVDANGKEDCSANMLPSAWFTIENGQTEGSYVLCGGGFGHGIGMSQYGADGMAKEGKSFKEILNWFFPGTKILV